MSNNERGFTLVEAVVAMVVCTIGLVAMAELLAVTLRLQQLGRNSTSAVRLAQDKVDELTTMTFRSTSRTTLGVGVRRVTRRSRGRPLATRRWKITERPTIQTTTRS